MQILPLFSVHWLHLQITISQPVCAKRKGTSKGNHSISPTFVLKFKYIIYVETISQFCQLLYLSPFMPNSVRKKGFILPSWALIEENQNLHKSGHSQLQICKSYFTIYANFSCFKARRIVKMYNLTNVSVYLRFLVPILFPTLLESERKREKVKEKESESGKEREREREGKRS